MSKKPVVIIMAVLLLVATGVLVWNGKADDANQDAGRAVIQPAPQPGSAAGPVDDPAPSESAVPAATAAVVAASATQPDDPFKAFLEASKNGLAPAADAAAQVASNPVPQDPFKAAFDAGRRPEPVPLVSPFGARK